MDDNPDISPTKLYTLVKLIDIKPIYKYLKAASKQLKSLDSLNKKYNKHKQDEATQVIRDIVRILNDKLRANDFNVDSNAPYSFNGNSDETIQASHPLNQNIPATKHGKNVHSHNPKEENGEPPPYVSVHDSDKKAGFVDSKLDALLNNEKYDTCAESDGQESNDNPKKQLNLIEQQIQVTEIIIHELSDNEERKNELVQLRSLLDEKRSIKRKQRKLIEDKYKMKSVKQLTAAVQPKNVSTPSYNKKEHKENIQSNNPQQPQEFPDNNHGQPDDPSNPSSSSSSSSGDEINECRSNKKKKKSKKDPPPRKNSDVTNATSIFELTMIGTIIEDLKEARDLGNKVLSDHPDSKTMTEGAQQTIESTIKDTKKAIPILKGSIEWGQTTPAERDQVDELITDLKKLILGFLKICQSSTKMRKQDDSNLRAVYLSGTEMQQPFMTGQKEWNKQ